MRGIAYACLVATMTAAAGVAVAAPRAVVAAEPRAVVAAEPRDVLELFTSQGCSSCPPADKLLAQLAHDPQFIVLSLPVDYWDRLGWKDTFAKHAFTERQRAYAGLRGDGQVYTPQVVVNGSEHANGANRRAIDASAETTSHLSVTVSAQRTGNDIVVSVGGSKRWRSECNDSSAAVSGFSRGRHRPRRERAREGHLHQCRARHRAGRPLERTAAHPHRLCEGLRGIRRRRGLVAGGNAGAAGAILGATLMSLRSGA